LKEEDGNGERRKKDGKLIASGPGPILQNGDVTIIVPSPSSPFLA
jgi:hypothetical protein